MIGLLSGIVNTVFHGKYENSFLSFACFLFLICSHHIGLSQQSNLPLNRDINKFYDHSLNILSSSFHTSIKPYRMDELNNITNVDSLTKTLYGSKSGAKSYLYRKLRKEHLFTINDSPFEVNIDPVFNLELGQDLGTKTTFINTRGFWLEGNIGSKFAFSSSFYENQGKFIDYIDTYIRTNNVVPGQGSIKPFNEGFDYAMASGYVSYTPSKYFNFQFGHDKNFLGDGYRSLLLSDNSFNYPFLKITTNVWKIKYVNLYAQFLDIQASHTYELGYKKKYGTFHYLSWNITKRINLSLFESVIWQASDSTGSRGFDITYLNPVIFYRPVEFSLGSPDNALMGLNLKFKVNSNNLVYGQLILDEFKLNEIKNGAGWYANKQAFQLGGKAFSLLGFTNLDFQTEFNFVRPFMYSHDVVLSNYAHHNQALAHPLGSNFWESVSFLRYRYKSFFVEAKFMYSIHGADTMGLNFGNDLYQSYLSRYSEYGNYVGQGLKTTLIYEDIRLVYIVNPKTNLNIEVGFSNRSESNTLSSIKSNFFYIGFKTSLTNSYYDF